jgi:hypothetical protein
MKSSGDDILTAVFRFIPGAVFGALIGLWLVAGVNTALVFFGGIVTAVVVGGVLSARLGLRFWEALRHLRWFPF